MSIEPGPAGHLFPEDDRYRNAWAGYHGPDMEPPVLGPVATWSEVRKARWGWDSLRRPMGPGL